MYRAVFQLRKEIFIQRPVPDSSGEVGRVLLLLLLLSVLNVLITV